MPVPTDTPQRSPAPLSLSELLDDVASYVRDPGGDASRSIAKRCVNNAIRDLNRRHWYWSLTFQDITSLSTTADYELADDYDGFRSLQLFDANANPAGRLDYLDPQSFWDAYNISAQAGSPCHCTVDSPETSRLLTLNCIPTADWVAKYPTMRVRYFRLIPVLVAEADRIVGVPDSAQNYVLWYARYDACLIFDPDGNRLAAARSEKESLWRALVAKDTSYHYLA